MFKEGIVLCTILLVCSTEINSVFALNELERVTIEDPRLENAFGKGITDNVNVNQQIQISADITNNQDKSQEFVYLVQIKNKSGVVISWDFFGASLIPLQKLSPSLSWTPDKEGEYTAEIFVWEGLVNHNALSEFTKLQINVS